MVNFVALRIVSYDTKMSTSRTTKPTDDTFNLLQEAYDFFNQALFENKLPPCLILLHRKTGPHGYYWAEQFQAITDKSQKLDEIALNPMTLDRGDKLVLSTLVHEMVHLWQRHFGKPSRNGYHNRQWAKEMRRVGLMPTDTGEVGGKQTGQSVTHYIIENGMYDQAFIRWSKAARPLLWAGVDTYPLLMKSGGSRRRPLSCRAKERPISKQKFCCPNCEQNAWAKPSANLVCGDCYLKMEAVG